MYEKLEAVAPLLEKLGATLAAPDASSSVLSITTALAETAREISDAAPLTKSPEERSELQRIYRGLIAAKQLVADLHELASA
ncbi:MAG: type III secretion system protein [Trinickia sp.]|jgi:hypothetical protein